MSWTGLCLYGLISSGAFSEGVVLDLDGSKKETTHNYEVSEAECKALAAALTNPDSVRETGLDLGGVHYTTEKADGTRFSARNGTSGGVEGYKTGSAVVVGVYNEKTPRAATASETIEKLGTWLIEQGV